MAAAPPAADAACGGVVHFQPAKLHRPGAPPLAVGDSVMLGAALQFRRAGFEIDVRGCRQMSEGLDVLSARSRAGSLPDVAVVALGTNWTVTTAQIRSALRILGRHRVLGLVTSPELGSGPSSDQAVMRAAGRRWKLRVKVLDWVARSAGKPWTWDGMHLGPEGAAAYARLLSRAFTWPIPSLEMTMTRAATLEPPERLSG
ncbi:MAG: hypothetical protein H0T69_09865 [Thermoleophilaceae bacterium]|nr:hypothetical protein [Thermoleophilaceae bacterium]